MAEEWTPPGPKIQPRTHKAGDVLWFAEKGTDMYRCELRDDSEVGCGFEVQISSTVSSCTVNATRRDFSLRPKATSLVRRTRTLATGLFDSADKGSTQWQVNGQRSWVSSSEHV
jgi:hypothetical protein